MNKLIMLVFLLNAFLLLKAETDYKAGEFIVQFSQLQAYQEIRQIIDNEPLIDKEKSRVLSKRLNIWLLISNDKNSVITEIRKRLSKRAEIIAIQYNHYIKIRELIPDDEFFYMQWHLKNEGLNGLKRDADIDATEAWQITTGGMTAKGDEIVIAVVDIGFYLDHSDLDFWKNHLEIPGNSIDDDNNGYIDDYDGWSAFEHNGIITYQTHGNHVAGIIGAKGNNSAGVCGINHNIKIMPIKGASGEEAIVVEAYSYIYEMRKVYNESNGVRGAYIVAENSSFGIDYGNPSDYPIWNALYDSLGVAGVLSCAATANDAINVDLEGDMPTSSQSAYLITVTNTTNTDQKHPGSGFGANSIDLGAPGTSVMSTTYPDYYESMTGTSMACPQVSGAIGLIYSALPLELLNSYGSNYGDLSLFIKSCILESTDPLPCLNGITLSGGRLNVYKALMRALYHNDNLNRVQEFSLNQSGNIVNLYWQAPVISEGQVLLGYNIYRNNIRLNTGLAQQTGFSDILVVNDDICHYFVTAVYEQGESNPSSILDAVLLNPVPLLSGVYEEGMIRLHWTAMDSSGACRSLWGYQVYRNNEPFFSGYFYTDNFFNDIYTQSGNIYTYYVTAIYSNGESLPSNQLTITAGTNGIEENNIKTDKVICYPNPFREATRIIYSGKRSDCGYLVIYNCKGERIKKIEANCKQADQQEYIWNGEDSLGKRCSSGVYFYRIHSEGFAKTGRLILIK
jgi:hypothetical protein